MESKMPIKILLPILYAALLALSFFLNIYILLFCLSLPWSLITSFAFIIVYSHSHSDYYAYWILIGGIVNLLIWMCVLLIRANNPQISDKKSGQ